jgi:hypothetical protein
MARKFHSPKSSLNNRNLLEILNDKQQKELAAKLDKVWLVLDEFLTIKELLEMLDQQLNDTPFTFDVREERIQLLLNTYREKFQIHFDDSRKALLEIEKILITKSDNTNAP